MVCLYNSLGDGYCYPKECAELILSASGPKEKKKAPKTNKQFYHEVCSVEGEQSCESNIDCSSGKVCIEGPSAQKQYCYPEKCLKHKKRESLLKFDPISCYGDGFGECEDYIVADTCEVGYKCRLTFSGLACFPEECDSFIA